MQDANLDVNNYYVYQNVNDQEKIKDPGAPNPAVEDPSSKQPSVEPPAGQVTPDIQDPDLPDLTDPDVPDLDDPNVGQPFVPDLPDLVDPEIPEVTDGVPG